MTFRMQVSRQLFGPARGAQIVKRLLLLGVAVGMLLPLASAQEPAPPTFSDEQIATWKTELTSYDIDKKYQAVWALGLARESSAVTGIARIFDGTRWQLWESAAWALGNIRGDDALQALVTRSGETKFGRYVGLALGRFGSAAVPSLLAMLQSSDGDSRGAAAIALGQTRDARAIEPLLALLDDKTVFTAVSYKSVQWDPAKALVVAETIMSGVAIRGAALDALTEINDRRALAPLEEKLAGETDEKFRTALSTAVDKLRAAPMPEPPAKPKTPAKAKAPVKPKSR